jgi:hypothetical protein
MVKQDKWPKFNVSGILPCPTHHYVQLFTVSSKILCPDFLLIYTCSTFFCRHTAVVLCFALLSPLCSDKTSLKIPKGIRICKSKKDFKLLVSQMPIKQRLTCRYFLHCRWFDTSACRLSDSVYSLANFNH